MIKRGVLISQLLAIRAGVDAILAMVNDIQPGECQHPEEKRIDCSSMGVRRFQCGVCRKIIEEGGGDD